MTLIEKTIIQKITQYEKISLFFHEIPDFDALGACYALRHFLCTKFPEKKVNIIGLDILDPIFQKDYFEFDTTNVPNDEIVGSLGIILDTSNEDRVWSGRHTYCKELVRIDHHPQIETFAQTEWIDPSAAATCELIAQILLEWDSSYVDKICAGYLYAGIITDTGRFLYPSVHYKTFKIAAELVEKDFNRQRLNDAVYLKTSTQTKFEYYVHSLFKHDHDLKFGYAIIPKNAYDKYNVELRLSMVHVFNNIKNLEVWMTFYYDNTINKWRGSIRSRSIPINKIAEQFNGAGHKLAAGFTLQKKSEIKELVKTMVSYLEDVEGK